MISDQEEVPLGLVAPHIDFARGGHCYAWAYSTLPTAPVPDLVVVLGTAHTPTRGYFSVCGKDFETPWGPVPGRRDLYQRFREVLGPEVVADELVHRGEHSIEFQTVWLRNHYRGELFPALLPVLCGSFQGLIEEGREPSADSRYEQALGILKQFVDESAEAGKRVLLLASADLSHVGPHFGGRRPVTSDLARRCGIMICNFWTRPRPEIMKAFQVGLPEPGSHQCLWTVVHLCHATPAGGASGPAYGL